MHIEPDMEKPSHVRLKSFAYIDRLLKNLPLQSGILLFINYIIIYNIND